MEAEILLHDEDLLAEVNEMIDDHLEEGEPAITVDTLRRLVREGYTDVQAREMISRCVAFELTSKRGYSEKRYSANLALLPDVNFHW